MAIVKIEANTPMGNNFGYYFGEAKLVCPEMIGRWGRSYDDDDDECTNGGCLAGMVWKVFSAGFSPDQPVKRSPLEL